MPVRSGRSFLPAFMRPFSTCISGEGEGVPTAGVGCCLLILSSSGLFGRYQLGETGLGQVEQGL